MLALSPPVFVRIAKRSAQRQGAGRSPRRFRRAVPELREAGRRRGPAARGRRHREAAGGTIGQHRARAAPEQRRAALNGHLAKRPCFAIMPV